MMKGWPTDIQRVDDEQKGKISMSYLGSLNKTTLLL
jgi:hypothetical protein